MCYFELDKLIFKIKCLLLKPNPFHIINFSDICILNKVMNYDIICDLTNR